MSQKTFGFAIWGTGMIAEFHAKALAEIAGAKLVAAYNRSPAKGRDFAAKHGIAFAGTPEELLANPAVDVVCLCTPSGDHLKLRALCEIARDCPRGDLVEIGSWWGKSAFILLRLAQNYGIGRLYCVDPWSDAHLVQGGAASVVDLVSTQYCAEEAFQVFLLNLRPYAHGDLSYLRCPSAEGAARYKAGNPITTSEFGSARPVGAIALLHIDGNHSYACAKEDIASWTPAMAPGGWIIVDDYVWPFGDGPKRAGDEYLEANADRIAMSFVTGSALFIKLRA
ncbi:MAG: class I SAM-dependent methyltransferase [Verrucomicrobiota bacterium]